MTRNQARAIARALQDSETVERAMLAAGYARSTARRGTVSDCGCTGFRRRCISPRRHPAVIFAAFRLRIERAALRLSTGETVQFPPDCLAMLAAGVGITRHDRLDRLALGIGQGLPVREAMLQAGYSPASSRAGRVQRDGLRMSAARHPAVIARMHALRSIPGQALALDPLPKPPTRRQRAVYPAFVATQNAESAMLAAGYAKSTARAGRITMAGGRKLPPMEHPAVHAGSARIDRAAA